MAGSIAGFIFGCTDRTEPECYEKKLFGIPRVWLPDVQKIEEGVPLFLYNFNSSSLFGIFKAASRGSENIDPTAWDGDYPAQVRFAISRMYPSLRHVSFNHIVQFRNGRPYPILVKNQADRLVALFEGRSSVSAPEPTNYKTSDGHVVRSRGEAIIDESLFRYRIAHAYERTIILDSEELRPDFYLPEGKVYIEYWGGKTPEYLSRKRTKLELYGKHGINLVSLEDFDLSDIDRNLARTLSRYGHKFV